MAPHDQPDAALDMFNRYVVLIRLCNTFEETDYVTPAGLRISRSMAGTEPLRRGFKILQCTDVKRTGTSLIYLAAFFICRTVYIQTAVMIYGRSKKKKTNAKESYAHTPKR
jgi:hypothetical protein